MVVAICKLDVLLLDGSASLKDKRQIIRRIKDRVRNKFPVSIAEVGNQELWQRSELGVAVVSSDTETAQSILQSVLSYIESEGTVEIVDRTIEIQHH